jgi:hypothetical protein
VSNLEHQSEGFEVRVIADKAALHQVWEFDQPAYGRLGDAEFNNVSFDTFRSWRDAYPPAILGAYRTRSHYSHKNLDVTGSTTLCGNGERPSIVAVIGIIPTTAGWSSDFLERRVNEQELSAKDIVGAAASHWYISGISVDTRHRTSRGLGSFLGRFLQMAFQKWIETNGCSEASPLLLVAEGSTANGRLLLESLGFERASSTEGMHCNPRYRSLTTIDQFKTRLRNSVYVGRRPRRALSRLP